MARRVSALALAALLAACNMATSPSVTTAPVDSSPSTSPGGSAPGADLIIHGANVVTMEPDRPRATAVAIAGGRILAVGDEGDMAAFTGPATRIVDAGGTTVVPGFIDAHEHRLGYSDLPAGLDRKAVIGAAIEQGWTTIDELYVDDPLLDQFRALDAEGTLRLHVNAYLPVQENSATGRLLGDYFKAHKPGEIVSPHVRIVGLKVFTDFDNAKILLWKQGDLTAFLRDRYADGWPIAIKTVSTQSLGMILSALRSIHSSDPSLDISRTRLEHLLFATRGQIAEIKALGLLPIINLNNPGQLVGVEGIDDLVARNPPGSYAPWRGVFAAGIEPAGMTGYPSNYVDEPTGAPFGSPVHLVYQAVTRVGNLGAKPPKALLDQSITAEQALRALTINAARAGLEQDVKGSLASGKLADLVVLSTDPLVAKAATINDIRVLETMIGGEVAFCARAAERLCAPDAGSVGSSPATPAPPATTLLPSHFTASGSGAVSITATRSLAGQPPQLAIDGDRDTAWIAGDHAPQWIQLDFGSPRTVTGLTLVVGQDPAGATVHEIWAGSTPTDLRRVETIRGQTRDGQALEVGFAPALDGVRFIRILTTDSPSWVAWREIEVASQP